MIAGAGLGKTICLMKIAQKLQDSMQVAMLASSQLCTRRALLQSILYHLGMPYKESSEGNLRIQLQEYLNQPTVADRGVVLLVDEAQSMSVKLLDEIRTLTNTLYKGRAVLHLVMAGTLKLEDTLAHPQMELLNQRIVSRQYLTPLSHPETLQYLQRKIQWAGADPAEVFDLAALDAIHRASDGIPRLIEQLADQAIFQSGLETERPIRASRIGSVWTQLHQLPNPWSESSSRPREELPALNPSEAKDSEFESQYEPQTGVEFGSLDEEPAKVNLFQPFIEDPNPSHVPNRSASLDDTFRQLIRDLNLAAIQIPSADHAFVRAERSAKKSPKPVSSPATKVRPTESELVGVSVDGDDRDMIVVIEQQEWVSPFAIR
jgi:type II secretory pathway predicted ATPase ExeA